MALWLVAILVGTAGSLLHYRWGAARRNSIARWAALIRAIVLSLVVALLLNAPAGIARLAAPWVALDASASLARAGDTLAWRTARDSARAVHPDTMLLFGDSLRPSAPPSLPGDQRSDVRPVVERAVATGGAVVVVTDGELVEADMLKQLPAGSRVVRVPHTISRDAGLASLDLPRAVVGGDTVDIRFTLVGGSGGAHAGTATLLLNESKLATLPFDSLAPYVERELTVRVRIQAPEGPALLRAVIASAGDREPRNDTLGVGIDIAREPGAVFVSTSPDYDARYALAVLRGALALPTRGFYRVAPGAWRIDGTLAPVTEAEVRQAFRDAPIAILHGDTSIFGPPRQATSAPPRPHRPRARRRERMVRLRGPHVSIEPGAFRLALGLPPSHRCCRG